MLTNTVFFFLSVSDGPTNYPSGGTQLGVSFISLGSPACVIILSVHFIEFYFFILLINSFFILCIFSYFIGFFMYLLHTYFFFLLFFYCSYCSELSLCWTFSFLSPVFNHSGLCLAFFF